jgi:hypothetical protein
MKAIGICNAIPVFRIGLQLDEATHCLNRFVWTTAFPELTVTGETSVL